MRLIPIGYKCIAFLAPVFSLDDLVQCFNEEGLISKLVSEISSLLETHLYEGLSLPPELLVVLRVNL